jgi:hypothetical protein
MHPNIRMAFDFPLRQDSEVKSKCQMDTQKSMGSLGLGWVGQYTDWVILTQPP